MSKGKIKTVLFLIVLLLVTAVSVNLLMDMQSQRNGHEKPDEGPDPYASTMAPAEPAQPGLNIPGQGTAAAETPSVSTPAPTPAIAPPQMPTPAPTLTPAPTPSEAPIPSPAITPPPVVYGQPAGSGMFISDTGTPLNLRAQWYASTYSETELLITVELYLDSYQVDITGQPGSVNLSVGEQYRSGDCPDIKWEKNEKLETLLLNEDFIVPLPYDGDMSIPLVAQYQFGGVYSKVELPVILCGGDMVLYL